MIFLLKYHYHVLRMMKVILIRGKIEKYAFKIEMVIHFETLIYSKWITHGGTEGVLGIDTIFRECHLKSLCNNHVMCGY